MSAKTLNFEIDAENSITVTMSNSGRISLSDITAATIGNLGDGSWSGNTSSESLDTGVAVLRPWEDNSVLDKSLEHLNINTKLPPSYQQHVKSKRQLEDVHGHVDEETNKRQRHGHVDEETNKLQRLESYSAPNGENGKNMHSISYNDQIKGDNQNYATNTYSPPFNYSALTQSFNFNNQPSVSYVPWNKSETQPALIKTVSESYNQSMAFNTRHEEIYNQSTSLNPRQGEYYRYNQSMQLPAMPEQVPTWMTPDYQSTYPSKQTTNAQTTNLTESSNYQMMTPIAKKPLSLTNPQPTTNLTEFSNYQMMTPIAKKPVSLTNPQLTTNLTEFSNYQMMTPITKKPLSLNDCKPLYNSPGIDARFNDSLTNLLGSPPPDSPFTKNPFFGDLQALLTTECKREIVPQTLFTAPDKSSSEQVKENVFTRERKLQEQFDKLQGSQPEEIRQLSSFFRYQSAMIETERFRTLHESQYPGSYKDCVNSYYDNKLHKVMDRVEKSVQLLDNSNKENTPTKTTKSRPHLSKEAVKLMESWYLRNMEHPYPTGTAIDVLAQAGNIGVEQVKKWFANKRNRSQNTRTLTEIAMQKRRLGHITEYSHSTQ